MGNAPSSVPFGAQLNRIHVELQCYAVGPNTPTNVEFTISLTAPLSGGAGQQIYYTDIYPEVTLPKAIDSSKYSSNVSIDLLLDNASPGTVQFSGPASVTGGQQAGGLTAGPATLGQAGKQHNFKLGDANITLSESGAVEVTYYCPYPYDPAIIGTANVDTSSGGPINYSTGSRDGLPPTPLGSKGTVANIPLSCIAEGGVHYFNLTVSGVSPVALFPGQVFNISTLTSFITIPPDIVAQLDGFYGGEQTIIGFELGIDANYNRAGVGFGLATTNGSPGSIDVAYQFTATDANDTPTPLRGSKKVNNANPNPVIIALPLDGSLSTGPFTAGPSTTIFSAAFTEFSGQLGAYSVTYNAPFGPLPFDCNATFPNYLFTAPIALNG